MDIKQKTILIVDDDLDLCLILKVCLQRDYTVHILHTLMEANSWLAEQPAAVVLLDNTLPDGFGVNFLEQLINLKSGIKVILMTADINPDLRQQALDNGARYFLPKPFNVAEIKRLIPLLLAS